MPKVKSSSETEGYLEVCDDDKNLYFEGTFLKVRPREGPESELPHHWAGVSGFGGHSVHLKSSIMGDVVSDIDRFDFDFTFPEVGMYNYKKSVLHFCRTTNRQNKKGLCQNTASIYTMETMFHNTYRPLPDTFRMRQIWQWRLPNVQAVFSQSGDTPLDKVFTEIARLKAFARTINRNFFVAPGIDCKYPSLWFRRSFVGDVISPGEIVVRNSPFLSEAKDYFQPKGVTVNAAF